jgi:hypothetical protein
MGARRRKLNRELLGIDREAEKDEESFGFKGCQRGCSRRSLARFASFARVFFTYRFYPRPLSGCNRFFYFLTRRNALSTKRLTNIDLTDSRRSSSRREKYIEARKANSEAFLAICVVAAVIFGLVLWAHKHHL